MGSNSTNRWLIILGTVIVQIGLGTIYTWSLFNQALVDKFNWPLSDVATTFSITSFFLAFSTLFAGKLQERFGIRNVTIFSGLMLGLGLIASSYITSLIMLYLFAGVMVGFANGVGYISTLSNAIKWFPERKGLAAGISVGAYGTGSLLFKYINASLINSAGVSQAFFYWGIMAMALIITGAVLLKEKVVEPSLIVVGHDSAVNNYSVAEMIRSKQAYLLFFMFFTACMSGLYLIGVAKDLGGLLLGMDAATAANAVAMIAIFNTAGRIILGALSDKIGRMLVISFTFSVTILAVGILNLAPLTNSLFFLCVGAVAFCFGGNITVFPAIVGDFYGLKNHSKNYGIIYQGFGLGALSGAFVAGHFGGFQAAFFTIGVMSVISLVISLYIKTPHRVIATNYSPVAS